MNKSFASTQCRMNVAANVCLGRISTNNNDIIRECISTLTEKCFSWKNIVLGMNAVCIVWKKWGVKVGLH